ncbi:hypothetical protein ACTXT7_015320 [Hymenolepis weldensis]
MAYVKGFTQFGQELPSFSTGKQKKNWCSKDYAESFERKQRKKRIEVAFGVICIISSVLDGSVDIATRNLAANKMGKRQKLVQYEEDQYVRSVLHKVVTDALPQMRSDADVCYFHIPPNNSTTSPKEIEVEIKVCQVAFPISHPYHRHQRNTLTNHNSIPDLSVTISVSSNLLPRFDRLLSSQAAVLELICQLTRRLYCLDGKIAECLAKTTTPDDRKCEDVKELNETDAVLVGTIENLMSISIEKTTSALKEKT